MKFTVKHSTKYTYNAFVSYCHNIATIKPRNSKGQTLLSYNLNVDPKPKDISNRVDFFGNNITGFSLQQPHKELHVIAESIIDRSYDSVRDSFFSEACKKVTLNDAYEMLKRNDDITILDAKQYILESIFIRNISNIIKDYTLVSFQENRSVFEATHELMQRIFTDFSFVSGFTTISTPLNEVMEEKKGVCQDFAQIAIACLRSIGLPARYMSGYIETIPPPGKKKLIGADASHAWFAVFIPSFGWVDFDPTNNQIPGNQHLVIGWGRDYYDVPPLKGVLFGAGKSTLDVTVDIRSAKDVVGLL